jgi:hypothetical protein
VEGVQVGEHVDAEAVPNTDGGKYGWRCVAVQSLEAGSAHSPSRRQGGTEPYLYHEAQAMGHPGDTAGGLPNPSTAMMTSWDQVPPPPLLPLFHCLLARLYTQTCARPASRGTHTHICPFSLDREHTHTQERARMRLKMYVGIASLSTLRLVSNGGIFKKVADTCIGS